MANYEQKYNKLVEAIKVLQETNPFDEGIQSWVHDNVPELKESEDERIRKEIIRIFKGEINYTSKEDTDKYIAWLEKQKDVSSVERVFRPIAGCNIADAAAQAIKQQQLGYKVVLAFNGAYIPVNGKAQDIIVNEYNSWLEKQNEQKSSLPIWKYKRDDTPLLRDSLMLNKYGCVLKTLSGAIISDAWVLDYDELVKLPKEEPEKQGEQKPADRTEPKFKVGDWIVKENIVYHIDKISGEYLILSTIDGTALVYHKSVLNDDNIHLWYITDATDGDVLVCDINKAEIGGDIEKLPNITPTICIYQNVVKDHDFIHTYCSLYNRSSLRLQNAMYYNTFVYNIHPATQEQRDLLFQTMKEAGYKWDSEKKELKKIKSKTLNADNVIEWLYDQACQGWIEDVEVDKFVEKFKRFFAI